MELKNFIDNANGIMDKIEYQANSMGYNINGIFNREIFDKYKEIDERDYDLSK